AHISNPLIHVLPSNPRPPVQMLLIIVSLYEWAAVLAAPVKMPLPLPDPLIRLRAIVELLPQNEIPLPSQTLSMMRALVGVGPAPTANEVRMAEFPTRLMLVMWFPSIDQFLPPNAPIPCLPMLRTAQF